PPLLPRPRQQGRVPGCGRSTAGRRRRRTRLLQLGAPAAGKPRLDRRGTGSDRMSRTIAITGAAGGIGQALCRHFASEGAAILALDKSSKVSEFAASMQAEGFPVRGVVVDIGDADAVRE